MTVEVIGQLIDLAEKQQSLPIAERLQPAAFDAARRSRVPPEGEGLGYRRKRRRIDLSPWSVVVPGYLTQDFDDGATVFYFEDVAFHFTSIAFNPPRDEIPDDPLEGETMEIERDIGNARIFGYFEGPDDESDWTGFKLTGVAVSREGFLFATLISPDRNLSGIAARTLLSIRHAS